MQSPSLKAALFAASLVPSLLAQNTPTPCFETNLGTNLMLGDDQVAQGNQLGFTFPGPGNIQVTAIDISSNGFVWLGSNANAACCNGDLNAFLTDMPRIAPCWMDLYPPSSTSGVFFNTFPATPTSLARAVITWDQIPEIGMTVPFTVQLQLVSDGSFTFLYDANVSNVNHNVLVGCTEGVAAVANPIDFSAVTASSPHISGSNPTIHEELNMTMDLAGRSFEFLPNGTGGYLVFDRPLCSLGHADRFGRGCPQPAVVYELFDMTSQIDLSNTAIDFLGNPGSGYVAIPTVGFFTGYTNPITSGDDVVTGPFTLPFTFPFPGGSTNQIDISSNGFVWLSTGNFDARCCSGDPTVFVADGPSIAALWQDLNPSQGGSVHFDVDPNNTEVHITWANVPEYPNTGANTAQITLRSDGSFRLSWQSVANTGHDCLVGFSQGNGAIDPGSLDFSVALPFTMGAGGVPLALGAQAGSRPALGTTFTMELGDFPANSTLGVMALGFVALQPGIDLGSLGMPGCSQLISLDAVQFLLLSSSPTPFGLTIPVDNGLVGVLMHAQGLTLSPGVNALGGLTSNGLSLTIGQ